MVLPAVFLIHTATLNHQTVSTVTDSGETVYTVVSSAVSCRFVSPQSSLRSNRGGVTMQIVMNPRILLPAETEVAIGDTIVSTEAGYEGTFTVSENPRPVYEPTTNTVSHWSCEIMRP